MFHSAQSALIRYDTILDLSFFLSPLTNPKSYLIIMTLLLSMQPAVSGRDNILWYGSWQLIKTNLNPMFFFSFLLRVLDLWEEWRRHSGPCLFQKMRNLPLIWWWEMSTMHRSRSILPITPLSVGLSGIYSLFCFFYFRSTISTSNLTSCPVVIVFWRLESYYHPSIPSVNLAHLESDQNSWKGA